MGLFSGISNFLFGDPTDGINKATEQAVQGQERGANYLMDVDAPLLDYRNKALGSLSDYYMGGPEGQQSFYDNAMQSPAYQNLMNTGEEAVLRNAAATGGLRGGAVQPALAQNSQNVLQGLVNQQLGGISSFTNPALNTGNIANMYANIGNTQAAGTTAANQAQQNNIGNLLGLGTGLISGAGSLGWNPFGSSSQAAPKTSTSMIGMI